MSWTSRIREHPRYWLSISIIIGLVIGGYFYNFYAGTLTRADPIAIPIDNFLGSLSKSPITLPPVIRVSFGHTPLNYTYAVYTDGFDTAYTWNYQFANSTFHVANDWEEVIMYWHTFNPTIPVLYAVGVRAHFATRLVYGGWNLVNRTQLLVSFGPSPLSPGSNVPTVTGSLLSNFFRPVNATIISNYTPILDPNSPYPTGPNAYQAGAGPINVWMLIGSAETVYNGIIYGSVFGIGSFLLSKFVIDHTVHPMARTRRLRVRQEFLPFLAD